MTQPPQPPEPHGPESEGADPHPPEPAEPHRPEPNEAHRPDPAEPHRPEPAAAEHQAQGPTPPRPPYPGPPAGGGGYQPPYQPPTGPGGGSDGSGEPRRDPARRKGFFGALFDLTFRSFVAIKFASFIYVILLVAIAIGWIIAMIATLVLTVAVAQENGVLAVLMFLGGVIGGTIWSAVQLIVLRVVLEFMIAAIRTAENTGIAVDELERLNARR
ncbi:DUF4282 domain-containing protein [Nesterenkonia sp. NBAIMH1]|uniref:DUF4282 domain-containing protein n=1 Tax=Nesterenkonia sp. NBAIMH1 TaxID=2600320 RepID=UPI0011B5B0FA|nr:DUF4282 domain-containing protein [Nesterenkonia sp. NBAIMH1]